MHTNRFEFAVKIVLTILSIIDGLIALIINFPGKTTVLAVIYGLLFFIAAITFWLLKSQKWAKPVMEIALVITIVLSLAQSMAGIPLGIPTDGAGWIMTRGVLCALPAIIGLIYFNLDSFKDGPNVLLVFLHLFITFVFSYVAFLTIMVLAVSGGSIAGMPDWGQNVTIWGFIILAMLDLVYIVLNWLKIYRGMLAWVLTAIVLLGWIPLGYMAGFLVSDLWWLILLAIVVIFTTYCNNRVKNDNF